MRNKKCKNTSQIDLFDACVHGELKQCNKEHCLHTDLMPASYTGLYSMHKYWGKKPHNIVRSFIERYTQSGDLVLDPFLGC